MAGKFLVIWRLQLDRMSTSAVQAVLRQQDYGTRLEADGKLLARYHVVGSHGGAWIYAVDSNEELDDLLAQAPVYNLATYDVYPLAEMRSPGAMLGTAEE